MTKIDIYSGFLGAGKTTLIKKMIQEGYKGEKLVLIENEFGEIGIDGGFLQDAGINITEMNSGCICCSLVGDFGKALTQVIEEYNPDRIVIEPSGVGKLSDVIAAVNKVTDENVVLGYTVAVADASKVKIYMKNFGEFYNNQVETASTIILSRTQNMPQEKLHKAVTMLREKNTTATIVTTPWEELSGDQLIEAMEGKTSLEALIAMLGLDDCHTDMEAKEEHHCCCGGHGHHHHEDGHGCCGHHDHDHHHHEDGHGCCGHHDHEHHHHEDGHGCCGHHDHDHHHHEEGHTCSCGHDHHDHHHHDHDHHHHEDGHCSCGHDHHHHHADEVFTSWGVETVKKFTDGEIKEILEKLDTQAYGFVLRAKGIVAAQDGTWIHFDYVPGEQNVRTGAAVVSGKLCVIGAELKEAEIAALFGV
ncbi:MAG: GTP-binding protein [Oscillospiraceae bacterium]|nr:GTP-binding protein [Oscillospiraceae bacterium]